MIYFIRTKDRKYVKIGYTDKDVYSRLDQLQVGCPFELKLAGVIDGYLNKEKELHELFSNSHVRGEWFSYTDEIKKYVKNNYDPTLFAINEFHPTTSVKRFLSSKHGKKFAKYTEFYSNSEDKETLKDHIVLYLSALRYDQISSAAINKIAKQFDNKINPKLVAAIMSELGWKGSKSTAGLNKDCMVYSKDINKVSEELSMWN